MKLYKAVLLLFFIPIASLAQEVNLDKLDKYLEQTASDWKVPGMSVAVVKDGDIIFSKGYGKLDIRKNEKPDGNTLFAFVKLL